MGHRRLHRLERWADLQDRHLLPQTSIRRRIPAPRAKAVGDLSHFWPKTDVTLGEAEKQA